MISLLSHINFSENKQTLVAEECYTGLEDLQILLAVNVDSHAITTTFRMSHLTENPSIRTWNG